VVMDATAKGDLKHAPVARGLMQAAARPVHMRVERVETRTTRTFQAEKEVRIQTAIDLESLDGQAIAQIAEIALRPATFARPSQRQIAAIDAAQAGQIPMFGAGRSDDAPAS
jgi:hypothetical protein